MWGSLSALRLITGSGNKWPKPKKLNTILIAAGATAIATITAIIAEKAIKKSKKSEKAT